MTNYNNFPQERPPTQTIVCDITDVDNPKISVLLVEQDGLIELNMGCDDKKIIEAAFAEDKSGFCKYIEIKYNGKIVDTLSFLKKIHWYEGIIGYIKKGHWKEQKHIEKGLLLMIKLHLYAEFIKSE